MNSSISIQDIKNYIEGNANSLIDKIGLLPEDVKSIVNERQKICLECPLLMWENNVPKKCSECGCAFPMLCYSKSKSCPKNKWKKF